MERRRKTAMADPWEHLMLPRDERSTSGFNCTSTYASCQTRHVMTFRHTFTRPMLVKQGSTQQEDQPSPPSTEADGFRKTPQLLSTPRPRGIRLRRRAAKPTRKMPALALRLVGFSMNNHRNDSLRLRTISLELSARPRRIFLS